MATGAHLPETSLWANRKCLLICATVAAANMQYGLDSTVIASLQAMPGFLQVFGYEDDNAEGGYSIDVSSRRFILFFFFFFHKVYRYELILPLRSFATLLNPSNMLKSVEIFADLIYLIYRAHFNN